MASKGGEESPASSLPYLDHALRVASNEAQAIGTEGRSAERSVRLKGEKALTTRSVPYLGVADYADRDKAQAIGAEGGIGDIVRHVSLGDYMSLQGRQELAMREVPHLCCSHRARHENALAVWAESGVNACDWSMAGDREQRMSTVCAPDLYPGATCPGEAYPGGAESDRDDRLHDALMRGSLAAFWKGSKELTKSPHLDHTVPPPDREATDITPHLYGPILIPPDKEPTRGTWEGNHGYLFGMPRERRKEAATGHVPQVDFAVLTPRDEAYAIWTKGGRVGPRWPIHGSSQLPVSSIPHVCDLVSIHGDEGSAIRAKGGKGPLFGMPWK